MSEASAPDLRDYSYTQNRELSWLRFNLRVLEEAADPAVPPLERLKFLAIFSSNLDEFFMVRVGSLFDLSTISPGEIDNKSGMTPAQQLDSIYAVIPSLITRKGEIYTTVCQALAPYGIADLAYGDLTATEQAYIADYFHRMVLPILSPMVIGSHHPTPHFSSKALYIASLLRNKNGKTSIGFIAVPSSLPAVVPLPDTPGRFIRMETILLYWAPTLYGQYQAADSCVISATRNADVSFDAEKLEDTDGNFRDQMTQLLKKRAALSIVRLEIGGRASEELLAHLTRLIPVENHQIYFDRSPLNLGYAFHLPELLPSHLAERLSQPAYQPQWPVDLQKHASMIEQVQHQDRLLFFPYDSVDPFLQLLSEAADRSDVLSIKITIYRLASSSKIARILCRAAENGKEVIVLMELRARFDEANNIAWSKMLEEAGCKVVYGVENFKCHSKICLITMRTRGEIRYITQVGTGNYNEKTNTLYTDFSVMTASEAIGVDGTAFFQNMLINNLEGEYRELLVSPLGIRTRLTALIDEQIALGDQGYICIKANAITERDIIDRLQLASRAGVTIQLIIRGICCLRPGIPGRTENIQVTSIVGRFLEHARVYCFGRGAEAKIYISSADLMTRNLRRRVEIACPIHDPSLREQLLWTLQVQLEDNVKASLLCPDGTYHRKAPRETPPQNSQETFMRTSLHKPAAPAAAPGKRPGRLRMALQKFLDR